MAPFVLRVKGGEDTFFSPLENMHSEEDVSYAWRVSNKVKDALENGSRLENMSWRLWYRHQHMRNEKRQQELQANMQPIANNLQHPHQFWFDQHHAPPPPPTKDLEMMDYDNEHFILPAFHQPNADLHHFFGQLPAHDLKEESSTPWPLAATEYDLQRDVRDMTSPTAFPPDHLDSALASRMAAFSMHQPMSMPPSPIMAHMTPMSMHHRPQDAMNAAVYVETSMPVPSQSASTLERLLGTEQLQQHHGHPAARVRTRPQISLEIEGMPSSSNGHDHQMYHADL